MRWSIEAGARCADKPARSTSIFRGATGKLLIYQITPITKSIWLLSLLPANALVDGLAALKTFFHAVPELDFFFSILPAQQDNFIVHDAGEIQQPDIEIFYLHADGINFRQRVLDVLESFVALGATPRHCRNIHKKAAAQQDSVLQVL